MARSVDGGPLPELTSGRERAESWDIRLFRWFGMTLGILVVAYLFLDRGVAHVHPPKAKVAFIGEMTLAFGVIAIVCGTRWLRKALARDAILATLVAYMLWALFRTVPNIRDFGLQTTVRDAALWYYAGFGIALVTAATAVPDLPERFVRGFRRVVPWLSLWLPIALLVQRSGIKGPHFRWDGVPMFAHRPGNVCCAAVICLAFVLLVPEQGRARGSAGAPARFFVRPYHPLLRTAVVALDLMAILLGATQTRGGGLAALVGVVLIFACMERRRRMRILVPFVAGITLVLTIGLLTGASYHTKQRTVSVAQLFENAQSISGGSELQVSVNFRTSLWETILRQQTETSRLVTGFGFGPNLAIIGGLTEKQPQTAVAAELESAHNSLLDIFARTGIIGASLFLIVWLGWFRRMFFALRRFRGEDDIRGVVAACAIGCVAIFINCFFDPTLEGAQVAVVLFTLFGLGLVCARRPSAAEEARRQRLSLGLARPATPSK